MTTRPTADPEPTDGIDPATMLRLLLHEARVHAIPGRELRDLGDAILLHDPADGEPFWNRLEGLRWPADPGAFDRRLTEILVLFASLRRQPHVWAAPVHDTPVDLVQRLEANGFRDMGPGDVMILADPGPARAAVAAMMPDGVTVERLVGLARSAAEEASRAVVEVLLDAFEVEPSRRAGIEAETVVSLAHPWFTHYLLRVDGRPAAVARRATFDDASYLSSIGTAGWARGRGLGGLVTRLASADALAARSDWVYLGVFAENTGAIAVYERAGFERVGQSCPDLVLA
jgi:ribosomal protein S18 acetylase RimI-like enzyme